MQQEEELARYYQAHKDDPDEWGDAVEAPDEEGPLGAGRRRELSATITIRLDAAQAALIRKLAAETGQSYSQIVRTALSRLLYPQIELRWGQSVKYTLGAQAAARAAAPPSWQPDVPAAGSKTGALERLAG